MKGIKGGGCLIHKYMFSKNFTLLKKPKFEARSLQRHSLGTIDKIQSRQMLITIVYKMVFDMSTIFVLWELV